MDTNSQPLNSFASLQPLVKGGGRVTPASSSPNAGAGIWRLFLPSHEGSTGYQLAQLDDYHSLLRRDFPWRPPLRISLEMRASHTGLPGTWGIGLWNAPFSLNIGLGGQAHLPALPNAAWFFHASEPNYLSFDDSLPAQGFMAATFKARKLPVWLYALAAPGLAMTSLPSLGDLIRRVIRRYIHQSGTSLDVNVTEWRTYSFTWQPEQVEFQIDGEVVLTSNHSPQPPLGLVIWIDNQFAAWRPRQRPKFGVLPLAHEAWLEIRNLAWCNKNS